MRRLTRRIRQYRETAKVVDRRDGNHGRPFARIYTLADMRRLARVDAGLGQMSGLAMRVVLQREFHVFGNAHFERLAGISASHIYNLSASRTYRIQGTVVAGTKASALPGGLPGSCASTPCTRATATAEEVPRPRPNASPPPDRRAGKFRWDAMDR